jgi:nitrate reductase gamma subunit
VEQDVAGPRTPVYVNPDQHARSVHAQIACVACHTDVARNPHQAEQIVACPTCHATILRHVNMGAPHMSTNCAACHLFGPSGPLGTGEVQGLPVAQNIETGRVELAAVDSTGAPLDRTSHNSVRETGCVKCHVAGNAVGAPAAVLPARSVFCMACHDASPNVSVGLLDPTPVTTDWGSLVGLVVFGLGVVWTVSIYLGGEIPGRPGLTTMEKLSYLAGDAVRLVFSRRIFRFLKGIIADGLFQRRVLRESVGRWVIHALIFLPFLARFGLGLVTWLGQLLWPAADWVRVLSDKNTPAVAFAYDFLTCLMLLGVALALVRRFVVRDRQLPSFAQDKIAIVLLGAIVLVGILTEGIRLLSSNTPQSIALYSFLGYAVAAVLRPLNLPWTSIYPFIWYPHSWLAVALIAYLPFSKFMHIWAGPLIASLDEARKGSH